MTAPILPLASPRLIIDDLRVALPKGADRPFALNGISLTVGADEIVCLVGESGSGKSMTAGAIMRLLGPSTPITGGRILLEGVDLLGLSEAAMRAVRGARVGMIFQEPMTALNPLHTIGDQIGETFRTHGTLGRAEIERRVLDLLAEVLIPDPAAAAKAYPHELSGGQRQRAMIAMALALEPALLIADEPTTALDVTTQAQILALIRDLQRRKGTGVLFVTHDFGVVAEIADRVAVMRGGEVVEEGTAAQVLNHPLHPYTRALIAAVPPLVPAPPRPVTGPPLLRVEGLSKTYRSGGFFGRGGRVTHAVKDVSFTLRRGATLGIVGESGSGKSTLARCVVRLLTSESGSIHLGDIDLSALTDNDWHRESRRVQMVFQDPYGSLNPRRRVGELVAQGPIVRGAPRREVEARVRELFALVGLDPKAVDRFPHEFSGGQRQRIGLARALALDPDVLVADEAVSALDVSVQAQVLALLADLRERLNLSVLFITHDLRVAGQIADDILVMKDGAVVEAGPTARVFADPHHPYTKTLMAAVPGRAWMPPVTAADLRADDPAPVPLGL
ncbi:microcin ABC transporter ATP-binding protein [Rhodospirillum rubrum]|uniref:ABC transporter ATP-binding protein n=1 Tax=Rhodospirillum rubrum TaxID=1085 RepID=UPI001906D1ED|nr:ABC transporter ATP-binding protein [Rhodospirillum rubrum]MBK1664548.1 microcin ABC transporter ATP-binding protein [Rhodospirillum rubrum]MBK1676646.1 microcin ABC transporter ATP-binding protein [Rhodospirillum rubrum]